MKELIEKATKINEELVAKLKELEELEEPNLLGEDGKYFDKESMSIKDIEKEPVKPTFKEGDWILIKKPKDVRQKPIWIHYMDKFDGQTLEIKEINSYNYLVIAGWSFNPDWCEKVEAPKSETMVNELKEYFKNTPKAQVVKDWEATREFDKTPKPNKPKVGDICIFWDDNKSNAIIGKLTSIDKSTYPYGVAFMSDYENCIKFESMEQYNEFIEE